MAQRGIAAIRNDHAERFRYSGTGLPQKTMGKLNIARSQESIRIGRLVANRERIGRPVLINFSTELEL